MLPTWSSTLTLHTPPPLSEAFEQPPFSGVKQGQGGRRISGVRGVFPPGTFATHSVSGRRSIKKYVRSVINQYRRHLEVHTCCPSLSVELVQAPAPERRVGTCSLAKLVAPRGECALVPRDDVVRFQTCCLLHVHQLTTLLIHC